MKRKKLKKKDEEKNERVKEIERKVWRIHKQVRRNRDKERWKDGRNIIEQGVD